MVQEKSYTHLKTAEKFQKIFLQIAFQGKTIAIEETYLNMTGIIANCKISTFQL